MEGQGWMMCRYLGLNEERMVEVIKLTNSAGHVTLKK